MPEGESLNLMFLPSVTERSVSIHAVLDHEVEGQEEFTVSLAMLMDGSEEKVVLGQLMAKVFIIDMSESVPHACILWIG